MLGGGDDATTSTTVQYTPQQKAMLKAAMPMLMGQLNNPPTLPGFGVTQPFNPTQQAAHSMATNAALGPLSQFSSGVMDASNFLMGPALSPDTNPYLKSTAEAAVRPVTEALTTQWLPSVRQGAMEVGGLGGSRQHNLEDRAIGRASTAASDATSKIYSDAFQSGMGNMVKSIALAPQTQSGMMFPSSVLEGVGSQQYGLSTAFAKEAYDRYMQEQMMPYLNTKDILGTMMGLGTGTSTTTTGASPGLGGMIGGGLGGASIMGGLAGLPGMAALGGPWGLAAGAGLGALATMFA